MFVERHPLWDWKKKNKEGKNIVEREEEKKKEKIMGRMHWLSFLLAIYWLMRAVGCPFLSSSLFISLPL